MRASRKRGVNAGESESVKKGVNVSTHPRHQFLGSAPPPGAGHDRRMIMISKS